MEVINEMRLEFLSKSQNEAFARVTVAAFAAQLDPTLEEIADIKRYYPRLRKHHRNRNNYSQTV